MQMPWKTNLAVGFALALLAPAMAGAQTPVNLTDESLGGTASVPLGPGAVAVDCQPAGTSTVSYTVVGGATGPYPGTFEETGSYTIVAGQVTSFAATFTINSGATQITGTKTLRESLSAQCVPLAEPGIANFTTFRVSAGYEATITSPTGVLEDEGETIVDGSATTQLTGTASAAVTETFVSEQAGQTPGHVVGAGAIRDSERGHVGFVLAAKSDGTSPRATCAVLALRTVVKCLNATSFQQSGTSVVFAGQALVNGVPARYRIEVTDLGEPGRGRDTFAIETTADFQASGTLTTGNIDIID
jgi:hypothetical protein